MRIEHQHASPAICRRLRQARRVVVLTGAGVSAESGVPTFRDKLTGLWESFDPSQLATPDAFQRDPALVWGWYEWRRAKVLRARPNPAHVALARLAELVPTCTLVTQNVDDLHERGGSQGVLHLHGELSRPYCERCRTWHVLPTAMLEIPERGLRIEPPSCTACGGRVRPGVVWFTEPLPQVEWLASQKAARDCDVLLCVGTSAVIQPAASLVTLAARAGAATLQINPEETNLDDSVTWSIRGPAGELLPSLIAETWGVPPMSMR